LSFSLSGLLFRSRSWLEKLTCSFSVYVLQRDCGRADIFDNYVRGFILTNVRPGDRGYGNLAAWGADNPSGVGVSLEAYPPLVELEPLSSGRQTTTTVNHLRDVALNTDTDCGDCVDPVEPGTIGMVVGESSPIPLYAATQYTLDGGKTWVNTATHPSLAGISLAAVEQFRVGTSTRRFLVAEYGDGAGVAQGHVAYTDNCGATWTAVHIGGAEGHGATLSAGLFALDEQHIWLAAPDGHIYSSEDGAVTWTAREEGVITGTNYYCVHFDPSAQYGVCAGVGDHVAVSVDEGMTWTVGTNTGTGDSIYCCTMFDSRHAWVGTSTGRLFYSNDGCATWQERTGWPGCGTGQIRVLKWANRHVGYMVLNIGGVGHALLKTVDGGYTWAEMARDSMSIWGGCVSDVSHVTIAGNTSGGTGTLLSVTPA
jgi:photosystem II stability/assembly factor-like uncharacterized protein